MIEDKSNLPDHYVEVVGPEDDSTVREELRRIIEFRPDVRPEEETAALRDAAKKAHYLLEGSQLYVTLTVARGFRILRRQAMEETSSEKPIGIRYNEAFNRRIARYPRLATVWGGMPGKGKNRAGREVSDGMWALEPENWPHVQRFMATLTPSRIAHTTMASIRTMMNAKTRPRSRSEDDRSASRDEAMKLEMAALHQSIDKLQRDLGIAVEVAKAYEGKAETPAAALAAVLTPIMERGQYPEAMRAVRAAEAIILAADPDAAAFADADEAERERKAARDLRSIGDKPEGPTPARWTQMLQLAEAVLVGLAGWRPKTKADIARHVGLTQLATELRDMIEQEAR